MGKCMRKLVKKGSLFEIKQLEKENCDLKSLLFGVIVLTNTGHSRWLGLRDLPRKGFLICAGDRTCISYPILANRSRLFWA